jgi:hypothetical protein
MAVSGGVEIHTSATSRVELTVKEYAARERVSERTVWVWLAKGAVKCRKTPGGGIRVVVPVAPLKNTEEY